MLSVFDTGWLASAKNAGRNFDDVVLIILEKQVLVL